jgi:hypothetical protein
MNDNDFKDFDDKLYGLVSSYMKDDFAVNADQKTFNKYCEFRNNLIDLIEKTNDRIDNEEGFWK